jgi:three-Cys-motif partner protein
MKKEFVTDDDGLQMRDLNDWTEYKLSILYYLLDEFSVGMRRSFPYLIYIDLLAGPGKYKDKNTQKTVLGSPLISLDFKYPFSKYYFVEKNSKNSQALQERCSHSPYIDRIKIYTEDCNTAVINIVEEIKSLPERSLIFAFVDPEGLEVQWKTILKLSELRSIDLLINFCDNGINRNKETLVETNKFDLFFGGLEWRTILEEYKRNPSMNFSKEILDLYIKNLRNAGWQRNIPSDQTVRVKNTKGAPLYRLIYATRAPLGEKFWRSAIQKDQHGQSTLPGM